MMLSRHAIIAALLAGLALTLYVAVLVAGPLGAVLPGMAAVTALVWPR